MSSAQSSSCPDCLAWGIRSKLATCAECAHRRRAWPRGRCAGCTRHLPVKHGHCCLCQHQAALQLGLQRIRGPVPETVELSGWQLFFAGMTSGRVAAGRQRKTAKPAGSALTEVSGQLALLSCRHDFTRFDRTRLANPNNPAFVAARALARRRGEAQGRSRWLTQEVDEALVILLSQHAPGDRIAYSEIVPIDKLGANVTRTAEVLAELGLLVDDRPDRFRVWLEGKLAALAPGIADEVRRWAQALRAGTGRTKARDPQTIRNYLNAAHPHLLAWSADHQHLREITTADVRRIGDELQGLQRKRTVVALRSLFGFAHRQGRIFTNPTAGIRVRGDGAVRLPQPVPAEQYARAADISMTAARRVLLALVVIHAARPMHLAALTLDDVDLPNRRISIAGNVRHLDDLTRRAIENYLHYRREQWPNTANTHLLLTQRTAHDHRPVSNYWLRSHFRDLKVTLNQLRIDRQLEEALAHGPDPLHLAAVFGIAENTAIRYARAARQLLESALESDDDPSRS